MCYCWFEWEWEAEDDQDLAVVDKEVRLLEHL